MVVAGSSMWEIENPDTLFSIKGTIVKGDQVASGQAKDSPFSHGTIVMQKPWLEDAGVKLDGAYLATLNIDIAPFQLQFLKPYITLENIKWHTGTPAESFLIGRCILHINNQDIKGYVYLPLPATKTQHFQSDNVVDVVTSFIPNVAYGDSITISFIDNEIVLRKAKISTP